VSYLVSIDASSINLQATLAAASSGVGDQVNPHFPLTCTSALRFYDDNSLACEHARVLAGDPRTQACVDHSIAILLIELLREKEDADAG
jgi:hypothetical protein